MEYIRRLDKAGHTVVVGMLHAMKREHEREEYSNFLKFPMVLSAGPKQSKLNSIMLIPSRSEFCKPNSTVN